MHAFSIFQFRNKLLTILVLFYCLVGCSESDSNNTLIKIYGGSVGGPYNELIELFNARSQTLKSTSILLADGVTIVNCQEYREGCPLLSRFSFESVCENSGGSKTNLTRLGMRERNQSLDDSQSESNDCSASSPNDFALVQNFFVAGAAQTYCPYRSNKFGPDFLYIFEFTSTFPYLRSTIGMEEKECEQFFKNQMNGEYEEFDDLRIVLPLYNGLIQFVTANEVSESGQYSEKSLESLEEDNQRIFLRGINKIYAAEVLNRDPRFHSDEVSNELNPNWRFDERKILVEQRSDNSEGAPRFDPVISENADVSRFINEEGISQSELGNRLLACDLIGAYVISGEIISEDLITQSEGTPDECRGDYKRQQIQIPEVIIDAMTEDHPYYQYLSPPASWTDTKISALPGLITYLVANQSADPKLVNDLTEALVEEWDSLMLLEPKLTPIAANVLKKPAPFHEGAELALLNLDMLGGGFSLQAFLLIIYAIALTYIVKVIARSKLAYNRLGEKQRLGLKSLAWQEALDFLFIVLVWILVFMFVVTLIRNWDAAIAATQNSDDQISGLSFSRTLLWMFTFISSGYEDNVFPSSSASQIVISFFAIAGIAYPLFLIAQSWDRIRVRRQNRARGGEFRGLWRLMKDWLLEKSPFSYRSKGTLLLCGWNNRAPGLIYALTCPDSPFEGVVNIVADMNTEYPIEHYNFNQSRVRFYRGDPSHRSQLERAEASRATGALILSEHISDSNKNNAGILTALAIERFKSDISVFAELSIDESDSEFMQQHIDNIVDPRLIVSQAMSIACFDNYVLDFVLDALSPDNHYEWYSRKVSEFRSGILNGAQFDSVEKLAQELQEYNISIVGICSSGKVLSGGVFAPRFDSESQLDPIVSLKSMSKSLNDNDYVICAALDSDSFKTGLLKRNDTKLHSKISFKQSDESININFEKSSNILVIGYRDQAVEVKENIESNYFRISETTASIGIYIIATDSISGSELNKEVVDKLAGHTWTHIILLSSVPKAGSQEEYARLATRADSDAILLASFIRTTLQKKGGKLPVIISEVNQTHSRQLAQDAELDTVVPSSLLIERVLARLVSGGGKVPEMLTAMLSVKDDVYLRSSIITKDHTLIGEKYSTALTTWFANGRVLGILPKSDSADMLTTFRNNSDDFDWHFVMCPPTAEFDHEIAENDVIIVLTKVESS